MHKENMLVDILFEIINKPHSIESWRNLLLFGSTILVKPPRGGAKHNLSNIIRSRISQWSNTSATFTTTIGEKRGSHPIKKIIPRARRKAMAATSKLEDGNFKATVRLFYSDDAMAANNTTTLAALQ